MFCKLFFLIVRIRIIIYGTQYENFISPIQRHMLKNCTRLNLSHLYELLSLVIPVSKLLYIFGISLLSIFEIRKIISSILIPTFQLYIFVNVNQGEGGSPNVNTCQQGGGRGSKIPKILSTQFMNSPSPHMPPRIPIHLANLIKTTSS